MSHESSHLATRCVHAGELDDAHGSPHTPLYQTTTFKFATTADIARRGGGAQAGSLYTRYGLNPTIRQPGRQARRAGRRGDGAGPSAPAWRRKSALFLTHGRKGIVCLGDAYGGTLELLASQLPQLGIPTHLLLGDDMGRLDEILAKGVGLVFFETPTNPGLEIFDIHAIAKLAHAHGALVAVDNTFASPVNQQPLALGADFAVHSRTKYLGGHSDLTAGAVMGAQELLMPVWNWRKNLGTDHRAGDRRAAGAQPAHAAGAGARAERQRPGGRRGDGEASEGRPRALSGPGGLPRPRAGKDAR